MVSGLVDSGVIVGVAAALIGAIVGASLSYALTKALRRNERLIQGIYRPLLGQLGQVLEKIRDADSPDLKGLDDVRQDGMYFVMDERLKGMTSQVYEEIKGYKDMYDASSSRASAIVRELVQNFAPKEDLDRYRSGGFEVSYRGFIDHAFMGTVTLHNCLLIGKTPVERLIEKRPLLKESDIDCNIGGYTVERYLADEISKWALQRANLDQVINDARAERQLVLRDLQHLIKILSARIL